MGRGLLGAAAAALGLLAAGAPQAAAASDARFALQGGCFAMSAGGERVGPVVRLQATRLGSYLLFTPQRRYLAAGAPGGPVTEAAQPSPAADWAVTGDGPFSLRTQDGSGTLRDVTFAKAEGCPVFPEIGTSTSGEPRKGASPYAETRGFADAHMHLMAYEFLGGRAHCGQPWHPYGVERALPDCNEDVANGSANSVLETALKGSPPEDQRGWPTFRSWPAFNALAHEASYYRWLERAWKGGLRLYVNLLVDNEALCNVYPFKRNPCDDMNSVRLQAKRTRELEDYVDAQAGGPGKGWFRIVKDPFEARKVINDGKMAVVLGIEVSRLFGCGLNRGVPTCDKAAIRRQLDEVHALGVRQMELINKFDNAFGGVAGDSGTFGVAVNSANFASTGNFWNMRKCDEEDAHVHDREQPLAAPDAVPTQDAIFGAAFKTLLEGGQTPVYGPGPHCNALGLSDLGAELVNRMMDKGMMVDPDHLSVLARKQLLSVTEARDYAGVVSSHSWSTPDAELRILRAGGFVAPYAGSSEGFVKKWEELQAFKQPGLEQAIGYGADANGFGTQGPPRASAVKDGGVKYPFKSFDGAVTFERQRSGERTFDLNKDGVAHYGLYPDWVEDLRVQAGEAIVEDLSRSAESYLRSWELATGVPRETCREGRLAVRPAGSIGTIRVGLDADELLRRAGQPSQRVGRRFSYCVAGRANGAKRVRATLAGDGRVALVGSTAPRHRIGTAGPGRSRALLRGFRAVRGTSLLTRRASATRTYVAGVTKGGRIRFVGVATRATAAAPGRLAAAVRTAGL
jgi:hypothetical protein